VADGGWPGIEDGLWLRRPIEGVQLLLGGEREGDGRGARTGSQEVQQQGIGMELARVDGGELKVEVGFWQTSLREQKDEWDAWSAGSRAGSGRSRERIG